MSGIRVVLADDSPFLCRLLAGYLKNAGGFDVVGLAHNGAAAIEQVKLRRPDVLALDLTMPDRDGVSVIEEIMRDAPTPVVVITGVSGTSAIQTLRALDAGAADFVLKFDPSMPASPEALTREIITKLRRVARKPAVEPAEPAGVVVVGSSTGGPTALREMLSQMTVPFPAALVVVQHVPSAFSGVLASDLARISPLPVAEYRRGERLAKGEVRVAPGGLHFVLGEGGQAQLEPGDDAEYCPSIDRAMESAARAYGEQAVGVLLTGMGADGVQGLTAIRQYGGYTIVQDPATCVVPGMPEAALRAGVADAIAPPAGIGHLLAARLGRRTKGALLHAG